MRVWRSLGMLDERLGGFAANAWAFEPLLRRDRPNQLASINGPRGDFREYAAVFYLFVDPCPMNTAAIHPVDAGLWLKDNHGSALKSHSSKQPISLVLPRHAAFSQVAIVDHPNAVLAFVCQQSVNHLFLCCPPVLSAAPQRDRLAAKVVWTHEEFHAVGSDNRNVRCH